MQEMANISNVVYEKVDLDAQIIIGTYDAGEEMNDEMQVTVIAAGFDEIEDTMPEEILPPQQAKTPSYSSFGSADSGLAGSQAKRALHPIHRSKDRLRRSLDDDYEVPPFLRKSRR